jgi:hypothetical protein
MQRKSELLHRYWFEFEKPKSSASDKELVLTCWPPFGCGVTGYDYDDAVALMKRMVFSSEALPNIATVSKDADMSVLLNENEHIWPNISCPVWRGVWWPRCSGSGPFIGSVSNEW